MATRKIWTVVMGLINCGISIIGIGVTLAPMLAHTAGVQTAFSFLFFIVSLCFTMGCIYGEIKPKAGYFYEIRHEDPQDQIMSELDAIARKNFEESQRSISDYSHITSF